ncbi:O-antigen ligase family protein [Flaviflagellibacter deserti]|uniref:O-antigen ligase family protein n=1 Tax=Flaviflagellibacter deserti TaxID=2267266 RepID=A0ABV9Z2L4_9HYPH
MSATHATGIAAPRLAVSREGLARFMLWLFVFSGSFVLIEPSPYEAMFIPTLLFFMLAGLRLHATAMPLVILLVLFNIGGAMAATRVLQYEGTVEYVLISAFMLGNAVFYAALLTEHTLERFAIIKTAYIATAMVAAVFGIVGYFNVAGTSELLTLYSRAKAFFKDPNVYSPFLVLPLVLMLQDMLLGRARTIMILSLPYMITLIGLFLSFSRAAWTHVVLSSALAVLFLLIFSNSARLRLRVMVVSIAGGVSVALGLVALLSIPAISKVFEIRASLEQDYDVSDSGRFANQARGLAYIMDNPLGIGPHAFARIFEADPHNVFMNAFFSYGWLGGFSYAATIVLTWAVGYKALFKPSPYRLPFGAVLATFTVLSLQGFIIDTDHWRHFFLLLGLTWGFIAAVSKYQQQSGSYFRTTA